MICDRRDRGVDSVLYTVHASKHGRKRRDVAFFYSCRGGCTAHAMGWLEIGGGSRALVGSRGEVGMSERGTQDIPRFGALRRDNTPSPAECG